MADVNKLRGDVKWWEDEIRIREGKVEEAKRTLADRQRELADAERAEKEEASQKRAA